MWRKERMPWGVRSFFIVEERGDREEKNNNTCAGGGLWKTRGRAWAYDRIEVEEGWEARGPWRRLCRMLETEGGRRHK